MYKLNFYVFLVIKDFASSHRLFSGLTWQDQDTLLTQNTPMYLQYVLAKYFSSDLGIDQISWILGGQIPAHVKALHSITNDV